MSAPCRATRPDGSVVVMYVGWAIVEGIPYVLIDDPTTSEVEMARQNAMEGKVARRRRELYEWLRRNMPAP